MIVSACMGLSPRIGGVYEVRYAFVTACTGYSPGGPLTISVKLTVHSKRIGGKTPRPLNLTGHSHLIEIDYLPLPKHRHSIFFCVIYYSFS